jgi:uncharacterized protein
MLLDTSGLLCLHHKAEPYHLQAGMLYKQAHNRLTHSYWERHAPKSMKRPNR